MFCFARDAERFFCLSCFCCLSLLSHLGYYCFSGAESGAETFDVQPQTHINIYTNVSCLLFFLADVALILRMLNLSIRSSCPLHKCDDSALREILSPTLRRRKRINPLVDPRKEHVQWRTFQHVCGECTRRSQSTHCSTTQASIPPCC